MTKTISVVSGTVKSFSLTRCHLAVASASTAVPRGVLATLVPAALLGSAAESADGAVSGEFGRAGDSGELQGIAAVTADVETVLSSGGGRQVGEDLGGLLGGASSGEGDEEEESGGELHVERFKR